jgi:hypothetical protein
MYLRRMLLGRASTRVERGSFHGSLLLLRFVGGEVDDGLLSDDVRSMVLKSSRKDLCELVENSN